MTKKTISYGLKELKDHRLVEDKKEVILRAEQKCECGREVATIIIMENIPKKEVEKFKVGYSRRYRGGN